MKRLLSSAALFLLCESGALVITTVVAAGATASITVSRSNLGVGPEAIKFSVDSWSGFDTAGPGIGETFDARHRDLIYLWNFNDTGATFSGPTNVLTEWRDANIAYGSRVAHVFGPGTYTPSVLIFEPSSGKTATVSVSSAITVSNPDTFFSTGETTYVHPSADYSASPATAGNDASDIYAVLNGFKGAGATAKRRVILEGGQTYPWSDQLSIAEADNFPSLYIDVQGSGRAAQGIPASGSSWFRFNTNFDPSNTRDFSTFGLSFNGGWDVAANVNAPSGEYVPYAMGTAGNCGLGYALIHDNLIEQVEYGVRYGCRNLYLSDTRITNWGKAAIFGTGSDTLSWLGCTIDQTPLAISSSTVNSKFGVRDNGSSNSDLIIDGSEFFCAHGWSGAGGVYIATQPAYRFTSNQVSAVYVNCQRSSFEGGFTVLDTTAAGSNTNFPAVSFLIERCALIGEGQTSTFVLVGKGGTTLRNNLVIAPEATRYGATGTRRFFNVNFDGDEDNRAAPIRIYNNTLVNRRNDTFVEYSETTSDGASGTFTSLTVANNVIHQPAISPAQTSFAPLVESTQLFTPRIGDYVDDVNGQLTVTLTAAHLAAYSPDTGSSALGGYASGPTPVRNITGAPRIGTPNIGAW